MLSANVMIGPAAPSTFVIAAAVLPWQPHDARSDFSTRVRVTAPLGVWLSPDHAAFNKYPTRLLLDVKHSCPRTAQAHCKPRSILLRQPFGRAWCTADGPNCCIEAAATQIAALQLDTALLPIRAKASSSPVGVLVLLHTHSVKQQTYVACLPLHMETVQVSSLEPKLTPAGLGQAGMVQPALALPRSLFRAPLSCWSRAGPCSVTGGKSGGDCARICMHRIEKDPESPAAQAVPLSLCSIQLT